ncbi:diacylglycerol kinase family protein [Alicyclobacillus macrosporangiidus]|jgi:diacylglycerol kinase|uniref:Diacylglycerol kinase (ATP) n=1 Tax=Alicyclobacillus macrosporangiidus TaxID=392015 RepID=A0A1I7K7X9_9BACL|nr:diacylglycerol kinase family protein [Alicyclobacillus macrosporangiidus]SFU93539.1 diacylglycerol kinase (ATP) [Alicyclobacillus macrosporangiidus]
MPAVRPPIARPLRPRRPLADSFRFALDGICHALITERNMKIHFAAGGLLLLWCLAVRPPAALVLWALAAVHAVIALELVNTAVERVTDLATGGTARALAGVAKDVAAGAVLIVSMGALGVGIYLGVSSYPWRWRLFSSAHPLGAVESLWGLSVLCFLAVRSVLQRKRLGWDDGEGGNE